MTLLRRPPADPLDEFKHLPPPPTAQVATGPAPEVVWSTDQIVPVEHGPAISVAGISLRVVAWLRQSTDEGATRDVAGVYVAGALITVNEAERILTERLEEAEAAEAEAEAEAALAEAEALALLPDPADALVEALDALDAPEPVTDTPNESESET